MRSDQLVQRTRYTAYIGDAAAWPEYTDQRVLDELNDKLLTVFEDPIVKTRQGYWLKATIFTTSSTKSRYRIPPRAAAGGFEKLEIAQSSAGPWMKLAEIPAESTARYESANKSMPTLYTVLGDQLVLMPAPDQAYALRCTYYLRPSQLVTQQSSTENGGTVRGQITSITNIAARQVTVNALPFDMSLAVPAAITSATQLIDIVHPNGWQELSLVNATQTIAGNVITIGGSDDLSDIEMGDFVRVAQQTDWPCIPEDYHRCLADIAAIKIMTELKIDTTDVANNVQADMLKFRSILQPRSKSDPQVVPVSLGSWGGWFPS